MNTMKFKIIILLNLVLLTGFSSVNAAAASYSANCQDLKFYPGKIKRDNLDHTYDIDPPLLVIVFT